MSIGYKVVVERWGDARPGYWSSTAPKPFRYQIGKTTTRTKDAGPMAVFDDLKSAMEFVGLFESGTRIHLFLCEYETSADTSLWSIYRDGLKCSKTYGFPGSTVFADKVTLLAEVKIDAAI